MEIIAAALNFSVYFSLSVVSCHLRWRWRCLECLPPPWQGVWWSDGSVLTVSSLGFLWTNKNIMLSLKNRRHVFVDVIFHDVFPRGSGAITSLFSLHISSQKRLILKKHVCCSDLSGFRINEVEERPDSRENKLFAPGTQTHFISVICMIFTHNCRPKHKAVFLPNDGQMVSRHPGPGNCSCLEHWNINWRVMQHQTQFTESFSTKCFY